MAMDIQNILKKWGLDQSTIDKFQEHGITPEIIEDLTPELLKELIPHIGTRLLFQRRRDEHFGTVERKKVKKCEKQVRETVSDSDESIIESNKQESDDGSSVETKENTLKRKNFERAIHSDVEKILLSSRCGRTILNNFKEKSLPRRVRNDLLELLVDSLMNRSTGQLRSNDFYHLAADIVKVFPKEDIHSYYVPPVSKKNSANNKSRSASGKLVEKYRNRMQRLKYFTESEDVKRQLGNQNEPSKGTSEVVAQSVEWLQKNNEPWNLVKTHWEVTNRLRKKEFIAGTTEKLTNIFNKWRVLHHPEAWNLIKNDFAAWEPDSVISIADQWPRFIFSLLKVCPIQKNNKIERAKEILAILDRIDNEDDKAIAQMILLPYMIPPRGRVRTKKEHWKPSMKEAEESFVVHVQTAADIANARSDRIEAMSLRKLTVQPYIIAVGPSLGSIEAFYVSVDEVLYKVPTAFDAIDVCFKTFHVFNISYPSESHHLWYLIQRQLYKLETKFDRPIGYIIDVLTALRDVEEVA
ncbi:uncharacterized protein LOC143208808 [Lasioglossum baleicum]|uniref:uncharacterized protein LOC143208808 n=1 Tax=Lasioglossum baleicum TaxID=434251 RepID=UPI003FCE4208